MRFKNAQNDPHRIKAQNRIFQLKEERQPWYVPSLREIATILTIEGYPTPRSYGEKRDWTAQQVKREWENFKKRNPRSL